MLIAGNADVEPVVLASDDTAHIIRSGDSAHLAVVLSLHPNDTHTELGRISMCSTLRGSYIYSPNSFKFFRRQAGGDR
jgi:hypothetical protein